MTAGTSPAPGTTPAEPGSGTATQASATPAAGTSTDLAHRTYGWFQTRMGVTELWGALTHVHIPVSQRTFFLGGVTMFLFIVQVVTGSLLALYYKPTPEAAYESVIFITSEITFGWLIRSIHHWAANLMIVFLILHVVRIFFQATYKYPRELTWLVGGGLLGVTIFFGFTGYLLPWDQRAYWATVVGTEIAGSVPVIGDILLQLLRGGADVTDATLSRFFGIHVLFLPLALGGLLALHLTIVHQQGLANRGHKEPKPFWPEGPLQGEPGHEEPALAAAAAEGAGASSMISTTPGAAEVAAASAGETAEASTGSEAGGEEPARPKRRVIPFVPDYMLDEVIAWYFVLGAIVVLASIFPAGIEEQANPLETPEHIKPEWYFLAVYEFLKFVPRIVGVLAPMVALVLLVLLPFLDRNPEVIARRRPFAIAFGVLTIVVFVVLTLMGYYA
jgi:quinol-cytochrome oxidoreductase complex cytochrome b subunit